ncbi:MAG: oxidoreductase [Acidimicrobiia bacterium]|nr:MAG: oxidoreductase [Acidimicrobiia bacterium]
MDEVRLGIVGVRGIGQAHAWAARQAPRERLVALCDVDAQAVRRAADGFGVEAFTDARDLYRSGAADAVVIATPPGSHGALVRDALDAGLHVYCEKPVAPTADEGYELAEHARAAGRVLAVGFQFRHHKGFEAVRRAVEGIGAIERVQVTATNWFRPQEYFRRSPWRATWRAAGGGVLMNQAIHQLDAVVALAGMPARVRARVARSLHDAEVEDDAHVLLEWGSGARGVVVASLDVPGGREALEVYGTRGAVVAEDGYSVRVARHDDVRDLCERCPDEYPVLDLGWHDVPVERSPSEWLDMLVAAHADFTGAVAGGHAPLVDAVAGTRAVELANAAYWSALEDRTVELPLARGAYRAVFEALATGRAAI